MTLIAYRNLFRTRLAGLYLQEEIDAIFKRCIEYFFSWSSLKIGLEPQYELLATEQHQLDQAITLLSQGMPLQYVFGTTTFMELELKVSPAVLIPRPETEELVTWVLEHHSNKSLELWDLCSGSGCISLGLKSQRDQWRVTGYELSEAALEVAQFNAQEHKLSVRFLKQDVLQWKITTAKVDVIVSNPPYVLPSEKKQMHTNVLDFEPEMALFVPELDPLLFYREILWLASKQLNPKGRVYFEVNPLLIKEMIALGKDYGFAFAKVKKDIFGKDRFIQYSKHDD